MAGGTRRVVVGFLLEGDEQFRASLDRIRQSAEDFGVEGAKSAQVLVDQFTAIERGAVKVAQKISDGKQVSDRDLKAMQQAYAALSNEIEDTFGAIEQAPVEIQQAFSAAEARIGAATAVVRDITAEADKAKEKFNELADAYAGVGDTAVAVSETLTPEQQKIAEGFDRWKRTLDEFDTKLREQGDVGKGEIEKIWKAQELLRIEMERTGATVEALGPTYVAEMGKMEAATRSAEVTVQKLETTVELNEQRVKSSAQSFSSLGDALQQLDGPIGAAAVKMGLLTAAFDAGWSVGQRLNTFMKTDMQEWDDLIEGWGTKLGAITERVFDNIVESANYARDRIKQFTEEMSDDVSTNLVESWNFWSGLLTGDKTKVNQALNEINQTHKSMADSIASESKDAADSLNRLNQANLDLVPTVKKTADDYLYGRDQLRELNREVEGAPRMMIQWSDSLRQAGDDAERFNEKVSKSIEVLRRLKQASAEAAGGGGGVTP